MRPGKPVWYKGKRYPSRSDLWREHAPPGLNLTTFIQRLCRGYSVAAALKLHPSTAVTIGDTTYPSFRAAVAAEGVVGEQTAYQRRSAGWSDVEAILATQEHKSCRVVIDGVPYRSIAQATREAGGEGVTIGCVRARLRRGWDVVRAIKTPPQVRQGMLVEVQGVEYESVRAAWEAVSPPGLRLAKVYRRLQAGNCDVEEAFLAPPRRAQG